MAWKKWALLGAYLYSGLACGVGVLLCTLLAVVPLARRTRERWARAIIHRLCGGLVSYLRFCGVMEVTFEGFAELKQRQGVILTANHPTYIDAILLMSQLPQALCLTKAGILRNPWVATLARNAGYESNGEARRMLRHCQARLRQGENLLIFPEGTRTTTPPVGEFKRGLALIARQAGVPVVTILVLSGNGSYLRKGERFFDLSPPLPLRYSFKVSQEMQVQAQESTAGFSDRLENHFRQALSLHDPLSFSSAQPGASSQL